MPRLIARFRDEGKFYATLLALGIGSVAIIVMAWFAAQSFAGKIADLDVQRRAERWHERALTSLQWSRSTFAKAELTSDDKQRLQDLLLASDIYRYVLYDKEGKVFWSSKLSKVSTSVEGSYFQDVVAKGGIYSKPAVKKASEIDGLLWRKGARSLDPDARRQVIEVYFPVMSEGRFIGAVEVYVDKTDLIAFYARQARVAASALSAAFAAIFLAVGAMMFFYASERRANIVALTRARDEAVRSEASARELAAELQRMNDDVVELNRELAENMKKLGDAQNEIVRKGKLAQLGQLTATVAHEIRNPLGAVRTAAYLIERKIKGKGIGIEQALQRINNGVIRCDNIITELLDFARSKALQLENVAVDDWIARLAQEQASRLPEAVAIECHLGLGERKALFDPGRMQRVVINLLANASEAMVGKGDDPAKFATADPRIVVATRMTRRGIEIAVSDNGPGISEENLMKIREPLFTTKTFGVGLGIPAVEKILEQHEGGLDIHSKPGAGATVVAWFPAQQAKTKEAA